MDRDHTCLERVCTVIAETLDVERPRIDESSCAATLPAWDSLAHLMILSAVERAFGVKLPRLESYTVKNVGELTRLVETQLSKRV